METKIDNASTGRETKHLRSDRRQRTVRDGPVGRAVVDAVPDDLDVVLAERLAGHVLVDPARVREEVLVAREERRVDQLLFAGVEGVDHCVARHH